nr:hypothetical protein [Tanacetum cinerariifolium]
MTSFGYRLNPRYAIKECLSCGTLYTGDFYCSKGNVEDKILVPKPPKNWARCAKCGHPVNGPYCQECALLREKLEEDLVAYFQNFQNTSESSSDSTNVVNAPREPFVVKQDHGVNHPHIDKCCCECGNALDGIYCQQCICKPCGKGAHTGYNCPPKVSIISNPEPCNQTMNNELPQTLSGFDPTCYFDKEKSVPCVSKPNFVDESSNIFNPPPQPPIYSCKFCGSNAQYGHYYTPQAPFNNPEPGYSQDFNFPQNIHDFQQQYFCCDRCGGPHETFQCQQVIFHEPCCENCRGPHENFQCQPLNYCEPNPSYDSYYFGFDQFGDFYPQQYLCCENCGGPHENFQCQPTNEDYYHEQNSCYNSNSFGSDHCQPPKYTVNHPIFNAHNDFLNSENELYSAQNTIMEQMTTLTSMCEMVCQFFQKKQEEKRIEEQQAANARYWKILACCDDDDDYDSAITPVLSTEETKNSLSMGNEHLDTISATESDELIKSSVEDLVSIPSESDGIPDTMCDVHLVNNSTPLKAKDHFEIVINSNDDISSSDDDSLYKENIEYVEASPHDSEVVSLEVAEIVIPEEEEIEDDNLREKLLNVHDETNTFHNSLPEFENFYFDLGEISSGSTTTHYDISLSDNEAFSFNNDHIKEISSGSTTTHSDISLSEYDSFTFDLLHDQCLPTDRSDFANKEFTDKLAHIISPPEYDRFYFWNFPDPRELISIFNSGIHENLSTTYVNLPIEDDHSPLLAYVVWIFLAYLTYPVIPPYLHSFGNEDTIFDPGITINRFFSFKLGLSHRCGAFKKFNTHRSHLNEWSTIINGKNTPILDYSWKLEGSCQRILSSKSKFPQLQLEIILLHLAGSQPMLKSSYKAEASVIISIPPLAGGVADVVVEIKGTGKRKSIKGQNRIETGQKREAWRSREKSKAVTYFPPPAVPPFSSPFLYFFPSNPVGKSSPSSPLSSGEHVVDTISEHLDFMPCGTTTLTKHVVEVKGALLLILTNKCWVDGNGSNPGGRFGKLRGGLEIRSGGDGLDGPGG